MPKRIPYMMSMVTKIIICTPCSMSKSLDIGTHQRLIFAGWLPGCCAFACAGWLRAWRGGGGTGRLRLMAGFGAAMARCLEQGRQALDGYVCGCVSIRCRASEQALGTHSRANKAKKQFMRWLPNFLSLLLLA